MAYYYSPFRKEYVKEGEKVQGGCPFCPPGNIRSQVIRNASQELIEDEHYFWVVNYFPRFEGHTMIVPKRHLKSLEEESPEEILSRQKLTLFALRQLSKLYPESGFEIFMQYGEGSLQSVEHLYWHIVPAQVDDPLRGFQKMGHFNTSNEGEEKVLIFPIPIRLAREELLLELERVIGDEMV
jgi:diadenosine tetraphosphate (Ap4A) HIT family hydrolase